MQTFYWEKRLGNKGTILFTVVPVKKIQERIQVDVLKFETQFFGWVSYKVLIVYTYT